ncbi:DNA-processing protein DprA [Candidatus Kapabacteria bacterium]|nr:DNA-processing protein DprA [Candidatus Kapabacteria bacterium]
MNNLPKDWELVDLIKLSYFKGLTPSLLKNVVDNYNSYLEFIEADLPPNLNILINQGELFKRKQIVPNVEAEKQLETCNNHQINICTIWDENYPLLLNEIHQSPAFFFYKGSLDKINSPTISIVGTRKCSTYGKINTRRYANYFASKGVNIVSGLAYGIDTEAHLGAIESGGITFSVIASGIDKLSPQTAISNSEKIIESGGALISTYHCGVRALPPFFLQRNRIISGLSSATLVVESKVKGGSLNTAKFARDQDREVFAVPGNITSINSEGTNALIRDGLAKLTNSPESLFKELLFDYSSKIQLIDSVELNFATKDEENIYAILSFEPIHIDELVNKVNTNMSQLLVCLLNMEFSGSIKQLPGKYYIRN